MKKFLIALVFAAVTLPVAAKPYEPKVDKIEVPPPTVLPTVATPPDFPSRPLGADEAARLALHYQSNIAVARYQIDSAQGRTIQARSALLPQFSVGASYTDILVAANSASIFGSTIATGSAAPTSTTVTGSDSSTSVATLGSNSSTISSTSANSATLTATLRQLVFDFHHTRDLVAQARELENVAAANFSKVQMDTVANVKSAFYTYLQDVRLVAVQEGNVANQREHLKQAQSRFRAGLGLPSDVTRAQTAVADAVFNLQQARSDADVARVTLLLQMGVDPRTPVQINDKEEPDTVFEEPQKLFEIALARRPEMEQALANIRAIHHAYSAATTTSAPVVNFNMAYTGRLQEAIPQTNAVSLVFSVNWNAYDGGLERGKVKEAEGNLNVAKAQYEGTVTNVISDVSQDIFKLRTAEQKLKSVIIEEANALETVRLAEGRYRVGLGILLDVLDAQSALLTAQTNRINAETAISVARVTLQRAIGKPLEDESPGQAN